MAELSHDDVKGMIAAIKSKYKIESVLSEDVSQTVYQLFLTKSIVSNFDFDSGTKLSNYIYLIVQSIIIDTVKKQEVQGSGLIIDEMIPVLVDSSTSEVGYNRRVDWARKIKNILITWLRQNNYFREAEYAECLADFLSEEEIVKKLGLSNIKELKILERTLRRICQNEFKVMRHNPVDLMKDPDLLPVEKLRYQLTDVKPGEMVIHEVENYLKDVWIKLNPKKNDSDLYWWIIRNSNEGKIKSENRNNLLFFEQRSVDSFRQYCISSIEKRRLQALKDELDKQEKEFKTRLEKHGNR